MFARPGTFYDPWKESEKQEKHNRRMKIYGVLIALFVVANIMAAR
jgi:hypothetical protein